MTPEERAKLNEIYEFINNLKASSRIPRDVDFAFRDRFNLRNTLKKANVTVKNANSEDVTVNEAGSGSYAVMNDPVGFIALTDETTVYYIPYFNA